MYWQIGAKYARYAFHIPDKNKFVLRTKIQNCYTQSNLNMSKLIIIDDDPIHHKIVQFMLTKNELAKETTYTFDGKLVLDYLEENKTKISALPDFIFLDLYMPNHSGWDFLNGFQQIYKTLKKEIQIYVVSSSIFQMDINRTKGYPFVTNYITKPLMKNVFDNIRGRNLKLSLAQ